MKAAAPSSKKPAVDFRSDSFSLSHVKTFLGRLIQKAGQGETVYIVRGQKRFVLREVPPINPIPLRPPGYFAHCQDKAEIREENSLAKSSVIRPPKDLE